MLIAKASMKFYYLRHLLFNHMLYSTMGIQTIGIVKTFRFNCKGKQFITPASAIARQMQLLQTKQKHTHTHSCLYRCHEMNSRQFNTLLANAKAGQKHFKLLFHNLSSVIATNRLHNDSLSTWVRIYRKQADKNNFIKTKIILNTQYFQCPMAFYNGFFNWARR